MAKKMQKLLDRVNDVAGARARDIAGIEAQIEAQHKALEEAQTEASEAFENMNVTGYHSAKDKQRSANDSIEMLTKHLEKVREAPRLSEEDYKKIEDQIRAEYADTLQTFREQTAEHIKAIVSLLPNLEDTWTTGRDALHILQYECMNDGPFIMTASGKRVPFPNHDKKLPGMNVRGDIIYMLDTALNGDDPITVWND